jgi:protein O-GlcNAc transferase
LCRRAALGGAMPRPQSRPYHYGYGRSLRPCLAPPIAPRRRSLVPAEALALDIDRFEPALHALFDEFPVSSHPNGRRFTRILDEVPGLTRENNLALLNLAASMLEPDESYIEVGTYRGTSLIGAMVGNDDGDFVAIDNFSMEGSSRKRLEENLKHFALEAPTIIEGDAFELVPAGALAGKSVGVYYWDEGHTYEKQLDGLRMIEPWLADRALLIVDDTDWEDVERATRDYLEQQPNARLLVWIPGKDNGYPHWWEGVKVLAWEAGAGAALEPGRAEAVVRLGARA